MRALAQTLSSPRRRTADAGAHATTRTRRPSRPEDGIGSGSDGDPASVAEHQGQRVAGPADVREVGELGREGIERLRLREHPLGQVARHLVRRAGEDRGQRLVAGQPWRRGTDVCAGEDVHLIVIGTSERFRERAPSQGGSRPFGERVVHPSIRRRQLDWQHHRVRRPVDELAIVRARLRAQHLEGARLIDDRRRYGAHLLKDRGIRAIDAAEKPLIAASLLLPFLIGLLVKGTLTGALVTLVWAGLVRIFLLHHATFSINSICHYFGARRFETDDESTNVGWLSLATLGESWHNNHHAFPTSAFHGLRARELDLGGQFIRVLERLGLAWDVVRVSPERQQRRAASTATASAEPHRE
jgi:fatty acid desaturase